MESIGVALFEELDPTTTDVSSGKVSHAAKAKPGLSQESPRANGGDVPTPLVGVIGSELDALDWRPLAPGIWNVTVPMTSKTKGDLRLLKLEPGCKLPDHSHEGEELILVLRGSYSDRAGTHTAGDFAELDEEKKHAMVAQQGGCILLIGNEAKPSFLSDLN